MNARREYVLPLVLALLVLPFGSGCKKVNHDDWKLVWQDEFEGPAGQLPNPANWGFDVGTDWGNAQLEYDTARPENVALDGAGRLAITARQETYLTRSYTSGRILTRGHFEQAGGRFEARLRMPSGQGLWPAFWMLGADFASVGWPACGEIDIMEYRGQAPTIVHGSLHGPGYSGGAAKTRAFNASTRFDEGFHVFAVEWTSARIAWSVDGQVYSVLTPGDLPAGGTWVFNKPAFMLLNLAVGGNFVGPPNGSTVFPQQLLVDYVRVYRKGS
ncbi:MAG: glycoside hydrolase family 16 protein [Candidatus Eisenbacteria bacterium]